MLSSAWRMARGNGAGWVRKGAFVAGCRDTVPCVHADGPPSVAAGRAVGGRGDRRAARRNQSLEGTDAAEAADGGEAGDTGRAAHDPSCLPFVSPRSLWASGSSSGAATARGARRARARPGCRRPAPRPTRGDHAPSAGRCATASSHGSGTPALARPRARSPSPRRS